MVEMLLSNTRFFVDFQGRYSRYGNQRNELPQGSVLVPILYNIYTNDQLISANSKHFIYANNVAITSQCITFKITEDYRTQALNSKPT